jgi:crossover junction endodeoxyribonuclease RuvC
VHAGDDPVIRVIGIDPGLAGGLGVLDFDAEAVLFGARIHRTPTERVRRGKGTAREYDVRAMHELLLSLLAGHRCEAALELQGARPGQGVVSMYRTGLGFGLWWALLGTTQAPFHIVAPAVWKRHHGLLRCDKRASRLRAQQRFPMFGAFGKADEGPAEALLLAEYVATRTVALARAARNGDPIEA